MNWEGELHQVERGGHESRQCQNLWIYLVGKEYELWSVPYCCRDYQVNEMCEEDGGFKINENIELPKNKFNEWGQPNFYKPADDENALGPEYLFLSEIYYYRKGNPQVARYHIQVIRRKDGKMLGESVSYGRGGGDLPSPSYGSSFHCPKEYGDIPLLTRIFKHK